MEIDDVHYKESLKKLSLQKLKKTARKLSISSEGNKQELIDRIMKKAALPRDDKSRSPSVSPEPGPDLEAKDLSADTFTKENLQKLSSGELVELMRKTFSRNELIEILLREYKRKQKRYQVDDSLKKRNEKTAGNKAWNNAHERNIAPVAFGERMATDYDKIAKERERIRELKKKRKGQNDLRSRNQQAKANNLWSSPHEKVVKVKELKQPKKTKKKKSNDNRDKIADPVSREINEKREEVKHEIDHENEKDDTGDDDEEEEEEEQEETEDVDEQEQDEEHEQTNDETASSGHANEPSGSLEVSPPAPHRAQEQEADDNGDAVEEEEAEYF